MRRQKEQKKQRKISQKTNQIKGIGGLFTGLVALVLMLSSCSQAPTAQVSIAIEANNRANLLSNLPAHPSNTTVSIPEFGQVSVSASGLIKNRFCYAFHISAPDLMTIEDPHESSHDSENDSCSTDSSASDDYPEVRGLGILSKQAYAYGESATLVVPSGSGRRIDLLGFPNPYGAADPGCDKDLRIEVKDSTEGKSLFLIYGNYIIEPETDHNNNPVLLPGYQAGPDFMGFMATNLNLTLAPGTQSVTLTTVPWAVDEDTNTYKGPSSYGGGCHDENSNGPMLTTFPPANPSSDGRSYIYTGMNEGAFLEVTCPSGVNEVSLYVYGHDGSDTTMIDWDTGSAAQCVSANGNKAIFKDIPLGSTSLQWFNHAASPADATQIECMQNQQACIEFEVWAGDSDASGDRLMEGQFLSSARYQAAGKTDNNNLELNLGDWAPPHLTTIVGYKKNTANASSRTLWVQNNFSGEAKVHKVELGVPSDNSGPDSLRWSSLTTLMDTQDTDIDDPLILASGTIHLFARVLNYGLFMFADYTSGGDNYWLTRAHNASNYAGSWANDAPQIDTVRTAPTILTENNYIAYFPAGEQASPTQTLSIKQIDATPGYQLNGNTSSISSTPYSVDLHSDFSSNSIITGAAMDMPGSNSKHILYHDGGVPLYYTRCDANFSTCGNTKLNLGGPTKAVDMYLDGSGTRKVLAFSSQNPSGSTYHNRLNVISLGGTDGAPTMTALDLDGDGTPNEITEDIATFYPPLPEELLSEVKLKTLRHADAAIQDDSAALLYFEHGTHGYLYRTRNGGFEWHLVWSFDTSGYYTSVIDIHPIHLYNGTTSGKKGFALLVQTDGYGVTLIGEDGQHGF